jgi:hypothetical protein
VGRAAGGPDRAEYDYRVNQLALTYLIAWHRDAHGADRRCVEKGGTCAEATPRDLGHDLAAQPEPAPPAEGEPAPVHPAYVACPKATARWAWSRPAI